MALAAGGGQVPPPTQLAGSSSAVVAFSGAGDEVGWVDAGGEAEVATVLEAPVSNPNDIAQVPGAPTEFIEGLALDTHGATLAYGLDPGGIEIETAAGVVLGSTADVAHSLAFSPDGTQLAFVAAGSLDVAEVQPGSTSSPTTSVCEGADQVLSQFVGDQVSHDQAGLAALTASGTASAVQPTPGAVDRGYVISSECTGASAAGGPTLTASARLIVDPTGTSAGQLTDETVVLGQSGGQWLVTGLSVPPLRAQGGGPHVLSVSVTPPAKGALNPESVVTITFNADLDPSSVTAGSLWLVSAGGKTIPLLDPLAYDADTREVTSPCRARSRPAPRSWSVRRSRTSTAGIRPNRPSTPSAANRRPAGDRHRGGDRRDPPGVAEQAIESAPPSLPLHRRVHQLRVVLDEVGGVLAALEVGIVEDGEVVSGCWSGFR